MAHKVGWTVRIGAIRVKRETEQRAFSIAVFG